MSTQIVWPVRMTVYCPGYTRINSWLKTSKIPSPIVGNLRNVMIFLTSNYDRVLSRIYMDWFLVKDQSNSLIYIWELTECNDFTDQSFCDQYIVTSGRNTHSLGPLTSTMPPPRCVFWSYFQFQDGKMLKQLIFYILCWLF